MSFIVVKVTVIAAHVLAALATGIFEHNLITAQRQIGAIADPVMFIIERHYLSPPQPLPRKISAGAVNTLIIG
jgi:hypothetical protein